MYKTPLIADSYPNNWTYWKITYKESTYRYGKRESLYPILDIIILYYAER
jgi:hypothetical protein